MTGLEFIKRNTAKIQTSLSNIIKIILILSIFYATYYHLWHILIADVFLLFLLFIPNFLKQNYKVFIPREFEFIFLIFTIITFFLGPIRGIVIQIFFGIAVGFIGFTIMLLLFSNSKIKTNYLLIILFAFSFSVAFGVSAELLKYYLKIFLDYPNPTDYNYTMMNLTLVALGSILSSVIGYFYMKGMRLNIMKKLVGKFKKSNPNFFIERIHLPEEVLRLIKKGENETLEFKSTLRTNLHTGDHDKKIEHAVLKTITAFLNSDGGILLIGITDKGEICGIEKDRFENSDKFNLHFTNMVKEKIGKEFIPYLNFELIEIENKHVLKVECEKSSSPVFLKNDGQEEFFIRAGSATTEVLGSKLIEYINHKFKK